MSEPDSLLDYREPEWVAEKLGLDKNTVYKYLQEGALPGVQLGRKWLVSERLLAEHLERETRKQTQLRAGTRGGVAAGMGINGRMRRGGLQKTPRLNRAMDAARQLAARQGARAVGTEHALVALAEEPDGLAAVVLRNLAVPANRLHEICAGLAGQAYPETPRDERLTASAELRQACALAVDEAIGMGHGYLGGEHVLLGILREPSCAGARMLEQLGVTYDAARAEVLKQVHGTE